MSKYAFNVDLSPVDAFNMVKRGEEAELVHDEFNDLGDGKYSGTLIFEKYYMRVSNRAALIVIIDNLKGRTEVRVVATGSSQGMIFNFDWGASNNFASSVRNILKQYIIS